MMLAWQPFPQAWYNGWRGTAAVRGVIPTVGADPTRERVGPEEGVYEILSDEPAR